MLRSLTNNFHIVQISYYNSSSNRRSQDFVWGALFFPKKVDDLFLVVALKIVSKYTSNLSHPA